MKISELLKSKSEELGGKVIKANTIDFVKAALVTCCLAVLVSKCFSLYALINTPQ